MLIDCKDNLVGSFYLLTMYMTGGCVVGPHPQEEPYAPVVLTVYMTGGCVVGPHPQEEPYAPVVLTVYMTGGWAC
jgi:hypothetical protein